MDNIQKIQRILRLVFLITCDSICSVLTTSLIYWVRLDGVVISPLDQRVVGTYALAIFMSVLILWLRKIYNFATRFFDIGLIKAIGGACLIYWTLFFSLTALLNFLGYQWVSKYVGLIQPVIFCTTIIAYRLVTQAIISKPNLSINPLGDYSNKKTYVYGTDLIARQFVESINKQGGMKVGGFIDDDSGLWGRVVSGLKVYSIKQFSEIARNKLVYELIIALPKEDRNARRNIFRELSDLPIRIRVLDNPSLSEVASKSLADNIRELDIDDLIDREGFEFDNELIRTALSGKVVLVTGAAGSIGSEISRQVLASKPKFLILFDHSEHDLYLIEQTLKSAGATDLTIRVVLGSILDEGLLQEVIERFKVQLIFHAAAYKHVPMLESNSISGIQNNVFGTICCVNAAILKKVEAFIFISTDKAVRPTSLMGATKRVSEMYIQAIQDSNNDENQITKFSIVRFGNVLGSSGSVIPLFRSQIEVGGPITVTSPEVTRFFMTVAEAVHLVLNAFSFGLGGEVFILDMGRPIKIIDLARKAVQFSGLSIKSESNPDGDIEIRIIGLRPGEKLHEELLLGRNPQATKHPMIYKANEPFYAFEVLKDVLLSISTACSEQEDARARSLIMGLVEKID